MKTYSFSKDKHLKLDTDFKLVYASRTVIRTRHLVIRYCENELNYSRLGIRVSKKSGNAPQRNRIKRLMREAFRLSEASFTSPLDLIFSPKGSWEKIKMNELQEEILQCSVFSVQEEKKSPEV